ncbi:P-loop containing nucleoside triphosphate hydrolase protein [Aureobasidium sp. EXF-3400]|nr:P-loop containing nucleoside triphosphate hydrolase protein [Aureobasidium sp. EXF-12344]KAI4784904.1 P-loop containing nucleoside triphosphate hydrolase protein [Aureobasidium sp. EXF-3400]
MFRAQLRRRPFAYLQNAVRLRSLNTETPLVRLRYANIYKDSLDQNNKSPLFKSLSFSLTTGEHWAIISTTDSSRTDFLNVLNGRYLATPPGARSYPELEEQNITPHRAISYIGFDAERSGLGGTAVKGQYLSQRYEAHREVDDWSLLDYLEGHTELNALEKPDQDVDTDLLANVVANLKLEPLLLLPVSNLSNGQTRRARIAKALLMKPELLLLDGPFMGLDPMAKEHISSFLQQMAEQSNPRILLSLRLGESVPAWITHVVILDPENNSKILHSGTKGTVYKALGAYRGHDGFIHDLRQNISLDLARPSRAKKPTEETTSRDGFPEIHLPLPTGEALVEMQGVKVSYGAKDDPTKKTVLGNWSEFADGVEKEGLWWNVRRGERWGVFGPNGSGKTTLLSLITSDHPQTYGLPIKLFGRSRIPSPGQLGISIFELQSRMGHSSPEVHTYFPKNLSVRRVLESAWADTPLSKPRLTWQNDVRVQSFLRWFSPELAPTKTSELQKIIANKDKLSRVSPGMKRRLAGLDGMTKDLDWADTMTFRDLPFSSQRLLLFLRALVSDPDLIILDEALSGMDKDVSQKCLLFLAHGEKFDYKYDKWHNSGLKFDNSLQMDNEMVNFGGIQEHQALLTISHNTEDIPGCIRQWICLPEPSEGKPARVGELPGPLELHPDSWNDIWNISLSKPSKMSRRDLDASAKMDEGMEEKKEESEEVAETVESSPRSS